MLLRALLNPKPYGDVGDMELGYAETTGIGFLGNSPIGLGCQKSCSISNASAIAHRAKDSAFPPSSRPFYNAPALGKATSTVSLPHPEGDRRTQENALAAVTFFATFLGLVINDEKK